MKVGDYMRILVTWDGVEEDKGYKKTAWSTHNCTVILFSVGLEVEVSIHWHKLGIWILKLTHFENESKWWKNMQFREINKTTILIEFIKI